MVFASFEEAVRNFETSFTGNTEGVCIVDGEACLVKSNAAFAGLLGYGTDDLHNTPFVSLVHCSSKVRKLTAQFGIYQFQRSSIVPIELELFGKKGEVVPVKVTSQLLRDARQQITGAVGYFEDLRKQETEEELQNKMWQTEQALQSVLMHSGDAIVVADGNGRVVIVNEALLQMLGYKKDELLGTHLIELSPQEGSYETFDGKPVTLTPAYINHQLECANELFEQSKLTYELYYIRKDGKLVPVETTISLLMSPTGEFKGSITICRDISRRKREEEAMRRLTRAVEQADEMVIMTDNQGVIEYVNPAFERITGYTQDEAIGRNSSMLKSGRHTQSFYHNIQKTITGGSVWKGRIINVKKDGTHYAAEASFSPIKNTAGIIVNYVAVMRDVTQEIKLEMQLRQVQKMQAIGTLAGGIAHEFNNILESIIGYTELSLDRAGGQGNEIRKNGEQVLSAAQRGREIVQQVLDFSRKGGHESGPVGLSSIIAEALRLIRSMVPAAIDIRQSFEVESDTITGNEVQIHQVLMNLCTNAAHAMREKGGVLDVHLRETKLSDADIPDLDPGDYLEIRVGDTGVGMDADLIDRIFDPFFSTKGPARATGMGLSVAHGIIMRYGGTITVESTLGKGSTFHVFLPKAV